MGHPGPTLTCPLLGERTWLAVGSELHAPAMTHIRQKLKMQLTKHATTIFYLEVSHGHGHPKVLQV